MPLAAWYVTLPEDVLVEEFRTLKYQRSLRWCRQGAFYALTKLIPVLLQLHLVRASWEEEPKDTTIAFGTACHCGYGDCEICHPVD
jgi:hypothetical protein